MRRPTLSMVLLAVAFMAQGAEGPTITAAEDIVQQYLNMSHPEKDEMGEALIARLAVLAALGKQPNALRAIRDALPKVDDPKKRKELAELCGRRIQTKESAILLSELLKDRDEQVRRQAISGLRSMARRTDRIGGKRTQRKPDFEPKVPGLVPHLISAANDKAEGVRMSALYALADSREPAAVAELRNRLKDKNKNVRLRAACLLTEYQDASGLPEMRKALKGLSAADLTWPVDVAHYSQAEMLLASFERITAKSFGEIPLNPVHSSMAPGWGAEPYEELLDIWEAWWNWQPAETARQGNPNKTLKATR